MEIALFLEGMYYAGNLPSQAEIRAIAVYLVRKQIVRGKIIEVEAQVSEAMTVLHQKHNVVPKQ